MLKDYYSILGVSCEATKEEIKGVYRTLALKFHPDVSRNEDASARMSEINEAYAVLSDESKRREYDREWIRVFGENGSGFNLIPEILRLETQIEMIDPRRVRQTLVDFIRARQSTIDLDELKHFNLLTLSQLILVQPQLMIHYCVGQRLEHIKRLVLLVLENSEEVHIDLISNFFIQLFRTVPVEFAHEVYVYISTLATGTLPEAGVSLVNRARSIKEFFWDKVGPSDRRLVFEIILSGLASFAINGKLNESKYVLANIMEVRLRMVRVSPKEFLGWIKLVCGERYEYKITQLLVEFVEGIILEDLLDRSVR